MTQVYSSRLSIVSLGRVPKHGRGLAAVLPLSLSCCYLILPICREGQLAVVAAWDMFLAMLASSVQVHQRLCLTITSSFDHYTVH